MKFLCDNQLPQISLNYVAKDSFNFPIYPNITAFENGILSSTNQGN